MELTRQRYTLVDKLQSAQDTVQRQQRLLQSAQTSEAQLRAQLATLTSQLRDAEASLQARITGSSYSAGTHGEVRSAVTTSRQGVEPLAGVRNDESDWLMMS